MAPGGNRAGKSDAINGTRDAGITNRTGRADRMRVCRALAQQAATGDRNKKGSVSWLPRCQSQRAGFTSGDQSAVSRQKHVGLLNVGFQVCKQNRKLRIFFEGAKPDSPGRRPGGPARVTRSQGPTGRDSRCRAVTARWALCCAASPFVPGRWPGLSSLAPSGQERSWSVDATLSETASTGPALGTGACNSFRASPPRAIEPRRAEQILDAVPEDNWPLFWQRTLRVPPDNSGTRSVPDTLEFGSFIASQLLASLDSRAVADDQPRHFKNRS